MNPKNKITQFVPILLVGLALSFWYFSLWCINGLQFCYSSWIHWISSSISQPLYFFALYSLLGTAALIFVKREIFNKWLKLALIFIPLAFIYVAMTPVNFTGIGINFFPYYRVDAARDAGIAFSVMTVVVILVSHFRSKSVLNK